MNSIAEVQAEWADTKEKHQKIAEAFYHKTNETIIFKEFRDFIESNTYGHGERSFLHMWDLIISEMPDAFSFLEIGVHKGQILAFIGMLADRKNKLSYRYGISPMDGTELNIQSDFYKDVTRLHVKYHIPEDYTIIKGLSTDPEIMERARQFNPLNILYIDGGHAKPVVKSDLENYTPLIKPGGYLVIDDSCNNMKLPEGYFGGIQSVTDAVEEFFPHDDFEFLFSVVHNRVYRKK